MKRMDDDARYRALVAHDARFDGLFFVGVTTTGIYCRPVCRARTPGRSRCVFFHRAIDAEREGFRACFRCRPELAPGTSSIDAVPTLARRAAARIEAGALNDGSLDDLASELGVSSRHVRRAVQREMGVSPADLAQSARLALAKQLVQDRAMPLVDVAYASGFSSVRRFNAAFREHFGRAPSSFAKRSAPSPRDVVKLALGYREPFAWWPMLEFLSSRATPGVERVDLARGTYARTVRSGDKVGWLVASLDEARRTVVVCVSASLARALMPIAYRVRALFDLDAEPHAVDGHLGRDNALRALVRATAGRRVPGAFDGFELGARAILGQQVTVRGATTLAGRLASTFGERVETPHAELTTIFPSADRIAKADVAELAALGLPRARAGTLHALATSIVSGRIVVERDDGEAAAVAASLQSVKGIGPWTAQYIAMRALRAPNAFPHDDLALAKSLSLTSRALRDRGAAWSPWRAYAAMHLWRKGPST